MTDMLPPGGEPYSPADGGLKTGIQAAILVALLCTMSAQAHGEWFLERLLDEGSSASFLSANQTDCIVADDSGNVHVIWLRPPPYYAAVHYRRFDRGGWSGAEYVGGDGDFVRRADLAVAPDGTVHVIWTENWTRVVGREATEMYIRTLEAWPPGYCENAGCANDSSSTACAVAQAGGAVHVVWRDKMRDGHYVLFHSVFPPYIGYQEILVASADSIGSASLGMDAGDGLHLVWCDGRHGNWEIYHKGFDGSTWGPEERLTESQGASLEPSVAAGEDGSVHLAWVERDGADFEVFHTVHDGATWSVPDPVSRSPGSARSPRLTVDRDGWVHVVWVDDRDGGRHVYYSVKSGASWSEAMQVTDVEGDAGNPGVASDTAGVVHVVWHDNRNGKNRVYWKALYPGKIPLPEIESVEPGDAFSGEVIDSLRVSGRGFVAPASAWIAKRGEPSVPLRSVRVISPAEILCAVDLLRVHHGDWDVIVENPNGSRDTLPSGFRIVPFAKPLALSMDTDCMESNLGLYVRSLVGGNFVSPVSVWFDREGSEKTVALDTKVRSPDTLEFTMNLDGVAPGIRNVVVENPDGRRDTLAAGFEVLPARWSEDVRLTDDPSGSMTGYSHSRTVAVDAQSRVHVVWYDGRSGHYEIYYKVLDRSRWSQDIELTSDVAVSAHPAIAIGPDGSIHVVWHDRRHGYGSVIYYKENKGLGWGPDVRISALGIAATKPSIAVDTKGDVHVAWCELHKGWQVMYRKRADGVWEEGVPLTEAPSNHEFASIAVDDMDIVHVVWQGRFDASDGRSQIYYTRSDGGEWWYPLRLSYAGDDCLAPSVAAGPGGKAHFVWHDACGEDLCEIHYAVWDGTIWHPQETITSAPGGSRNACVAVDDTGGVHVVWQDDRDGSQEMYYKSYDGNIWSPDVRLNATMSLSRKPSVAIDRTGRIHVVWHDDRDGNWEIYYKSRAARAPVSVTRKRLVIDRIAPNPTMGPCSIFAEVDGVGMVRVDVYDVAGRLVWEGGWTTAVPGLLGFVWDGCGRDGRPVASGVYFVQVGALRSTATGKVIVLR